MALMSMDMIAVMSGNVSADMIAPLMVHCALLEVKKGCTIKTSLQVD
jgi:hypothetical protein